MGSFYKRNRSSKTNRSELLIKLNSLVNRYGGDEEFVAHMDEWPRTIKKLIFSSPKLMIRFKLIDGEDVAVIE